VRSDLSQPTHRLEEEDTIGDILFLRLKVNHLRPKYMILCCEGMSVTVSLESKLSSRTKEDSKRRLICGMERGTVSCY
jgi:hypothetical protein